MIDLGSNVVVVRPVNGRSDRDPNKKVLSATEELGRRKKSLEYYRKYLNEFIPENTSCVVTSGTLLEDGEVKDVVVFGRFCRKFKEVRPVSELDDTEILNNSYLCNELYEANLGFLKMYVSEGVFADTGENGKFGSQLPKFLHPIFNRLTYDNLMIGLDENGHEVVFVDPDWYAYAEEVGSNKYLSHAKRLSILSARVLFFGCATMIHKLSSKVSRSKN